MRRDATVAWLRRRLPAAWERAAATWRAARARPEAMLAAAVVLGVFVMILHWS
jgi:type II secretory pathway component PulM